MKFTIFLSLCSLATSLPTSSNSITAFTPPPGTTVSTLPGTSSLTPPSSNSAEFSIQTIRTICQSSTNKPTAADCLTNYNYLRTLTGTMYLAAGYCNTVTTGTCRSYICASECEAINFTPSDWAGYENTVQTTCLNAQSLPGYVYSDASPHFGTGVQYSSGVGLPNFVCL